MSTHDVLNRVRVVALSAVLLVVGSSALAQSVEVIAEHLDNPRGLAFGPDGALYVAEAGHGFSDDCIVNSNDTEVCLGPTGRISRVWRGAVQPLLTGLPSLAGPDGNFATGPHDVSFQDGGNGLVVIGLAAALEDRELLGSGGEWLARLIRFLPSGQVSTEADLAALEDSSNPDDGTLDTNPYAALAIPDGRIVADADGNTVWWIKANGHASVLAAFPDTLVPFGGGQFPMQAVPNALAAGPDGAYYVGQLTGFPYPVGGAKVYRVEPGSAPTEYATGFTNIVDVAFGKDGSLYVLEFATNGILSNDLSSRIVRVWPNKTLTPLNVPGLVGATALAVGPDGALYVSNFGVFAGDGQILRIVP